MSYNLGIAEGRITVDGSGAKQGFSVAEAALNGFVSAVNSKIDRVERMGQRLVAIGAAGVTGFGVAVNAAANFEAELSGIEAVTGSTGKVMDQIRQKALDLGKDTAFSASEAAQAIEELAKAGVPVKDILDGAADATVNLAAAGGISLPRAAEIASAAMNQFSLTGQQLPHVADLIAGAANASAIDVEDFGQSLNQAGGVANLVGLKFDDLAVAIAEMGKQGYRGSDAGTSLKTMFLNLQPTTEQQKEEFENMGLATFNAQKAMDALAKMGIHPLSASMDDIASSIRQYIEASTGAKDGTDENLKATADLIGSLGAMDNQFFDAQGNMKSFGEIQEILTNATKNMTAQQKTASLEILFGQDAIRAASVAANGGAAAFDEMASSMSGISAADVAKTRMDNLKGSIEQFKGSLETVEIVLGNVVLPIVRKFVDGITWLLNLFLNLPGPIKTAIGVLFAIGTAFSLIMGTLTLLLVALPALLGKMLLFRTIGAATAGIKAFYVALRAGAGIQAAAAAGIAPLARLGATVVKIGKLMWASAKLIRAAWIFMTGPIGITIAAIAAVVAIFIYLYKHVQWFHDGVNMIMGKIRDFFVAAWKKIVDVAQSVADWFKGPFLDFFKAIPKFFEDLWDKIYAFFKKWGTLILAVLLPFVGIPLWIIQHWDVIVDFFKKIPGWIMGFLKNIGEWIANIFKKGWEGMTHGLSVAWDATLDFLKALPRRIAYALGFMVGLVARLAVDGWNGLWHGLTVAWNATWSFLTGLPGRIWDGMKSIGSSVADASVSAWGGLTHGLTVAWDATWDFFKKLPGRIWDGIVSWAGQVRDGSVMAWHGLVTGVTTAWDATWSFITGLPGRIWGWLKSMGTSIAQWATDAWNSLFTSAKDSGEKTVTWVTKLPGEIVDALADFGGMLWDTAKDAWDSFTSGITSAWSATLSWFEALPGVIGNFFVDAGSWLLDAGGDIIGGIWQGIKNAWNAFWDWLSGLWDSFIQGFKDAFGISSPSTVFEEFGGWIIEGLWNGIKAVWDTVWGWLKSIGGWVVDLFKDAGSWLINAGKWLISGFWNGIVEFWNNLWGWFTQIGTWIVDFFSSAGSWLVNAGKNIIAGLWNGIVSILGTLWSGLQGIVTNFFGFFADAGTWLLNVGKNIITGLWNGITSLAGWLWDQISGWLSGLWNNITGFFGINSPSKLFAWAGDNLVKGLAAGIARNQDEAVNSAMTMAQAVADGFHANLPDLEAMISANVQYLTPTAKAQLANDLAGLSAKVTAAAVGTTAVPASQEVQDHASKVENNIISNVYNPVAEKASDAQARQLRAVSALGIG